MSKLDEQLEELYPSWQKVKLTKAGYITQRATNLPQIKATILQEIKKDMPKPRGVKTKSMLFVDTFQESYNRALEDCLAAIKHLLG